MALTDILRFGNDHMLGELGLGKLLETATYKKMHTIKMENYACGWAKRTNSNWFKTPVYWHNGSDTMWYSLLVFEPESRIVVAVNTNDGNASVADKVAWEIVEFCFTNII